MDTPGAGEHRGYKPGLIETLEEKENVIFMST